MTPWNDKESINQNYKERATTAGRIIATLAGLIIGVSIDATLGGNGSFGLLVLSPMLVLAGWFLKPARFIITFIALCIMLSGNFKVSNYGKKNTATAQQETRKNLKEEMAKQLKKN